MAMPGTGDILVILFILALIFGAGKLSWLAARVARACERKGLATDAPRADGPAAPKAGRPTATPR